MIKANGIRHKKCKQNKSAKVISDMIRLHKTEKSGQKCMKEVSLKML